MAKNENINNENSESEENINISDAENKMEMAWKIPEKALNILDGAVSSIEKRMSKASTNKIIEKAKNSEKISKKERKISTEESEIPLKKEDLQLIDNTQLKEQYTEGILGVLLFINPFLELKGIDGLKEDEIRELVYAIFDLFEPNIKKIIKTTETNLSFIKNIRKLLNLGKAVWNIIAPRMKVIKNKLLELKAKREVEKLKLQQKKRELETQNKNTED